MSVHHQIEDNLGQVQQEIAAACTRSGRAIDSVQLVAVTKYAELPWVEALVDLGQVVLGESRPQQLAQRADELSNDIQWHLIGHLQRNKVGLIVPRVEMIHSVDSWRLLKRIDRTAQELDLKPKVLLEVNVSGEESKDGLTVEEVRSSWSETNELLNVDIQGFMTMAPAVEDAEEVRPFFRTLSQLRHDLGYESNKSDPLPHLSMGMSRDFGIAVEEGATLVRVGSSLYDGLK
jgi:PLP dependent protein